MQDAITELLAVYTAKYPQNVRDVAETLCGSTTRLPGRKSILTRLLNDSLRETARKHGIEAETLAAAVAAYSEIEERAESMSHRSGLR